MRTHNSSHDIIPVHCRREQDIRPGQTQEDTEPRRKQEQGTEPHGPASRVVADENVRGWRLRGRRRGAAPAAQERPQPGQRSRLPPGRGPVVGEVACHHVGRAVHGPGVGPGGRAGAGWIWRLGLALGLGLIGHGLAWGCVIDENDDDDDDDDVLLNDVDVDVFRLCSCCIFYPPACASLNRIYNGVEVFFFNPVSAGDSISDSAISCRTVGESSPMVLLLHSRY